MSRIVQEWTEDHGKDGHAHYRVLQLREDDSVTEITQALIQQYPELGWKLWECHSLNHSSECELVFIRWELPRRNGNG